MKQACYSAVVITALSTMLILSGCKNKPQQGATIPQPKALTSVSLATSKNLWCALPLIAKNKGFFQEEGLDVKYNFQSAGRYCMDAVVSGSTEFGNVVEVNVAFLAFSGNKDVRIAATCVESDSSAIIARKSRGIQKPEDLKGKRLALSPGTTSDVFANWFLAKHNIKASNVQIRKIQPAGIQAAVAAGEVDGASTWEPFVTNCRKSLGNDSVEFRDAQAYMGYENVAVRASWAEKNPKVVEAFMRALKKAEHFIQDHPAEAQNVLSQEINLDLNVVKETWRYYKFALTLDTKKMTDAVSAEGRWIHTTQEGFTDKPIPDYSVYFDSRYINAAR